MKRLPASYPLLASLLLGTAILLLRGPMLTSATLSNLGWLTLYEQLLHRLGSSNGWSDQEALFAGALSWHGDNRSASFGQGLALALRGDVTRAIDTWTAAGLDTATLADYGKLGRENGELDLALTQFRAADQLARGAGEQPDSYLAGTICQLALAGAGALSPANRDYCASYWSANGGNLILNGGFAASSTEGWQGTHHFLPGTQARLATEPQNAGEDFAARLTGQAEGNHSGLFQRLNLAPGDRVRFSGRFKMAGGPDLKARLLYIGWQDEQGADQGNQAETRAESLEWTTFEREFTVPEGTQGRLDFYPVVFSGVGDVWFDDIQLQFIR